MPTSAKDAERHLFITVRSQPAHRTHAQQLLLELVDLVRLEPGCLYYNLFQQTEDAEVFLLTAAWANDEAVAAHSTPAQSQVVERLKPLLASPLEVIPIRRVSESPAV
ncbi:hypothetical protein A0257_16355 [Hymenobacter psoromatis]|nr:hypothetical protein A0257_16355 [Hymenobacter psoromatis]